MASLGSILAASGIGQGLVQAPMAYAQGKKDKLAFDQSQIRNANEQKFTDFKLGEMDRMRQQQGIEDTALDGVTDEERLLKLAKIAGHGDLQRKYLLAAKEIQEKGREQAIANAAKSVSVGQFGPATEALNKSGIFGKIHSIAPADDVQQDPHNPTYSVYSEGEPDANGNPTRGPHVHVDQRMLYGVAMDPKDFMNWWSNEQKARQQKDTQDKTIQERADYHKALLQSRERVFRARQADGPSGGKMNDFDKRVAWGMKELKAGRTFQDEADVMVWATQPSIPTQEANAITRSAVEGEKNDIFVQPTTPKIGHIKTRGETPPRDTSMDLGGSPISSGTPAPQAGPDFKGMGFVPTPDGSWKNPKTGVLFKTGPNGQPLAWSNTKKTWVPVQ